MNAIPLLTGFKPAVWTPEQARRAHARMLKPWLLYLAECHGVRALHLDKAWRESAPQLPLQSLRMACLWRFGQSFEASTLCWPIQPGSLDLVIWRVHPGDLAELPALMGQINLALGPSARILICIQAPLLNAWCQVGMPLCQGHDWVMRQADWGDARALTLLPARWSSRWSASWQIWLQRGAQWSVQLWQRETVCPTLRGPKLRTGKRLSSDLRWQPQSTIDHSL